MNLEDLEKQESKGKYAEIIRRMRVIIKKKNNKIIIIIIIMISKGLNSSALVHTLRYFRQDKTRARFLPKYPPCIFESIIIPSIIRKPETGNPTFFFPLLQLLRHHVTTYVITTATESLESVESSSLAIVCCKSVLLASWRWKSLVNPMAIYHIGQMGILRR